jgi:capsular exopolysaccharide synthesis family protein
MESTQYSEDIDFQKYWLILKRRWLPASCVFVLVVILAGAATFLKKPTYEAGGRLLFKKKNTTSSLVTDAGGKIGELDSLSLLNTPIDTEAEVVRSIPIIQKTIEALNLRDKQGKLIAPEGFLKELTVKPIKGTDVLQISYKSKDAKEAADAVNELMRLYIETNVLSNRAEAAAAREFITKQLPEVQAGVRGAEAALRRFKEKNNTVALEREAATAVEAMANINRQIDVAQAQLADTTAKVSVIQENMDLTPRQAVDSSALTRAPGVQEVLGEMQRVQTQLILERSRFREGHPVIVDLESKEAGLKTLLQERVRNTVGSQEQITDKNLQIGEVKERLTQDLVLTEANRLGLVNQVASLKRAKAVYQNRANMLPKLQEEQRDLERQVEAAQSTYQILLKNFQEVQIAENQNVGNARVIEYALLPEKPVGARKVLMIVAGIVVGSFLYVITAFVVDLTDPTLKTAKEVRELFRYTGLGMIPCWKKKRSFPFGKQESPTPQLPLRDTPHAIISEAYRMLQANLKFLSPDRELKVIVVTSSVCKEGKSTVSANLAVTMAQLGQRVLLIDADMHQPIQHHIWNLTNLAGLSDVIVGQADVNTTIKEVMDNLDVLPSGVIPPNPLALLDSKRMASLVEGFSETYNYVIIDTPPLVLVADALTLGKVADGMLLVVRPGVVDTVSATASKAFLEQSAQNVLGIVVNGIVIDNEPDSYFHHAKSYSEDLKPSKISFNLFKKEKTTAGSK